MFLGHCLYVMMYPFHHWGDYQLLVCNSWMLIIWQPPESLLSAIIRPLAEAGDGHQSQQEQVFWERESES